MDDMARPDAYSNVFCFAWYIYKHRVCNGPWGKTKQGRATRTWVEQTLNPAAICILSSSEFTMTAYAKNNNENTVASSLDPWIHKGFFVFANKDFQDKANKDPKIRLWMDGSVIVEFIMFIFFPRTIYVGKREK